MIILKKILVFIIVLYLAINTTFASPFIDYQIEGDYVTITGLANPELKKLYIPKEVLGNPVKTIAASAFEDSSLSLIVVPKSIEVIEDKAMASDTLKKVIFMESTLEISTDAFLKEADLVIVAKENSNASDFAAINEYGFLAKEEEPLLEKIEFQEEKVSKAIQEKLGLEQFSRADLLQVDSLSLEGISYIEDFYMLSNLVNLELSNFKGDFAKLTDLNSLTNLKKLSITNSLVHSLWDLSGFDSLKELDLSDNYISNIEGIMSLSELTELNLKNNAINNIQALLMFADMGVFADNAVLNLMGNHIDMSQGINQFISTQLSLRGFDINLSGQNELPIIEAVVFEDDSLVALSIDEYIAAKVARMDIAMQQLRYIISKDKVYCVNDYLLARGKVANRIDKALRLLNNESLAKEVDFKYQTLIP